MTLITTATPSEAKPLITFFELKPLKPSLFKMYGNDQITLLIGGVGTLKMAIATTYALQIFDPKNIRHIFNIGICGGVDETLPLGTLFLINKITDPYTGKSLYPDILLTHPLREASISSFATPIAKSQREGIATTLVDMEATGFFQAAQKFLPLHYITLLKIVSDHLLDDASNVITPNAIETLFTPHLERLQELITHYHTPTKKLLSDDENALISDYIEHISPNKKLSFSTIQQLKHHLSYSKIKANITTLEYEQIKAIGDKYLRLWYFLQN